VLEQDGLLSLFEATIWPSRPTTLRLWRLLILLVAQSRVDTIQKGCWFFIFGVDLPADMSASAFHKRIDVIRYIPEVVRNWRGSTLMDADRIKVGARLKPGRLGLSSRILGQKGGYKTRIPSPKRVGIPSI
jgi:hypothetical protein